MIGHFISGSQHFLRFIGMLTKRGANKNSGNIGTHRQQIINKLRHTFVIQSRQCFKDI
ncbi:Uncharacterised protein [Shigella sonnei]|nr:Uncharacterised protein [Shigella sonnei]